MRDEYPVVDDDRQDESNALRDLVCVGLAQTGLLGSGVCLHNILNI